jgi:hypothetical protein
MARQGDGVKKLETFSRAPSRQGTASPYPWKQIRDDGGVWALRKEDGDYTSTDRRLQMTAHEWAARHNLRAVTVIPEPGVVEIQFVPKATQ